jgi:hypothetical protein
MRKTFTLLITLLIFSCSNNEDSIIGKWVVTKANGLESIDDDNYFVFNDDNSAVENNQFGANYRTWSIDENNLCIRANDEDGGFEICGEFIIENDKMIFDMIVMGSTVSMELKRGTLVSNNNSKLEQKINFNKIFGVWVGFQDSHYMINKFGDHLTINGEKILLPETTYNFLFEEGNVLSVQQKADSDIYNYSGNFTLTDSKNDNYKFNTFVKHDEYSSLNFDLDYDVEKDIINVTTKNNSPNFTLIRKGKSKKEKLLFLGSSLEAGAIFLDFKNTSGKIIQFVYYSDIENDIININNYEIDKSVNDKFCCDFLDEQAEYFQLIKKAVFDVEYFHDQGKNENTDFIYNIIVSYENDTTLSFKDFLSDFYGIFVGAVNNENDAKAEVQKLTNEGYPANFLWIPDFNSLSGAELYGIYIGPYYDENQFAIEVEKYREISPGAYGLLVSDKNERVEIRGPNKIKKKVN